MDLDWLEDFIAVIEHDGFSRAAEMRNITQPALSRRVRALEDWVGAPLIERTTHALALTAAGRAFLPVSQDILRRLEAGRRAAQNQAGAAADQLRFAATNALSFTFFPAWLRRVEGDAPLASDLQLSANHMAACERMLLKGEVQFLLCHHHPAVPDRFEATHFLGRKIGEDRLIALSAPEASGQPRFVLPGHADAPVPFLSYDGQSGMGRILEALRQTPPLSGACLRPVFASHLARLLVSMAGEGRGVAWLPESLTVEDRAEGRLVRAAGVDWDIPIGIHIWRPRMRLAPAAEAFWRRIDG